jgi:hypothetical protein
VRRATLTVLAIASALAALAGVVIRVTTDRGTSVGANVLVDKPGLIEAHNSPSLARDPRLPDVVVATYRIDRPTFSAVLGWSADGGRTWHGTSLPLPPGLDRPYAADAAFGPDGTLYVIYANLQGSGNTPANLWLARSSDGGRTLSAPVRVAGRLAFQARIAVDQAGVVYVTWLQGTQVGLFELTGPPSSIVESRSSDGARSFSPPVRVSDPDRQRVGAASPVIDSTGRLAVLYEDFKGDQRDFLDLPGPRWDQPFGLVLTRPIGLRSFTRGVELESGVLPTHRFLVFTPEYPSIAAGPGRTLYVAWSDGRNGDDDVFLRRSGDGGLTWAAPRRVDNNPIHDGTSQYLPVVSVSPDGRVDVLFLDRRRDRSHNVMTDATLASSHDGGASFQNTRLSSKSFDSRIGSSAAPQFPIDFGSQLGLAAGNGQSVAAWTDTRLGSVDTGRQDIFATTYRAGAAAGGLSRLPVIGILVVVALGLAVLALRTPPAWSGLSA